MSSFDRLKSKDQMHLESLLWKNLGCQNFTKIVDWWKKLKKISHTRADDHVKATYFRITGL